MSLIVDNCDWDKYWENKVLQKSGLLLKVYDAGTKGRRHSV